MYEFDYHRPRTLGEARDLIAGNEEAKLLAGGMTLLPTMKLRLARPSDLVDLGDIDELQGIAIDGNALEIGAAVRHADVAGSADVQRLIPALAFLAGQIGDPQVRNRGTLGGSIANSDPAADYPAAVLGLGASIRTDRREIPADDYFLGMFETALEPDEIVRSVRFPVPKRAGYAKFPNPASRYAIVGVMVAETGGGVRVAVTGAGPCAFRVTAFEDALKADFSAAALDGLDFDAPDLNSDLHASAEYRVHLVGVMAKRAVQAASG
ncbi:MAG TPA: xanthine dehydrogenase family protein subunit M [Woeseiaceae bacterium]|nr:xanthine dehydrogenase family protein subunit M [Woeseiaceae bacterium]